MSSVPVPTHTTFFSLSSSTMMLVQKPQSALSSPHSMTFSHRRQSSAPILVQPTRTPGLLSMSKPPKHSSPRQQRQNFKNTPKQPLTTPPAPPVVARAHPRNLTPAAHIYTHDKNLHNKRSPPSGKHNRRQPDPTMTSSNQQKPLQAEVPLVSANSFDPFLDHSSSPKQLKPIPPRSEPLLIHSKQRPSLIPKGAVTTREFPICDDSTDLPNDDHHPSTPVPRRLYVGAPHSAPISTRVLNPISYSPPLSSPSYQKNKNGVTFRNRNHRRSPSDGGVFHMSSDEDASSGPGEAVPESNPNPDLKALFALVDSPARKTKKIHPTTPARAAAVQPSVVDVPTMNMSTSLERAAFFASSLFQNSPSPDELPDPLSL